MRYFSLGHRLPHLVAAALYGDRKRHGLVPQTKDPCWQEWESRYLDFYYANQKSSIGKLVNDAGYRILRKVDLSGANVLEIGPGDIPHLDQWQGTPRRYVIADIQQEMLDRSSRRLAERNIPFETRLLKRDEIRCLPFATGEFDAILSFYSLEHLFPLQATLTEMVRILRPGGCLVGGIPTECGLAWGLGRFLTSRRWLKKHTTIDPGKIICWEHPNFAEHILKLMDRVLVRRHIRYWPLWVPLIDVNLVVSFVYERA